MLFSDPSEMTAGFHNTVIYICCCDIVCLCLECLGSIAHGNGEPGRIKHDHVIIRITKHHNIPDIAAKLLHHPENPVFLLIILKDPVALSHPQ